MSLLSFLFYPHAVLGIQQGVQPCPALLYNCWGFELRYSCLRRSHFFSAPNFDSCSKIFVQYLCTVVQCLSCRVAGASLHIPFGYSFTPVVQTKRSHYPFFPSLSPTSDQLISPLTPSLRHTPRAKLFPPSLLLTTSKLPSLS